MSNPTMILNGDQIFCDELIRENARLTVQHEADKLTIEALRHRSRTSSDTPRRLRRPGPCATLSRKRPPR